MTIEKARQDVHRDVGCGESDEIAVAQNRKPEREDRIARVRVDREFRHRKRARRLGVLVVGQRPDVDRGVDRVLAHRVRPRVEKRAMSATVLARRKVVDVAGVPVGTRRDPRIGAPAIVVHPRDHAMVAVFETHVDRIDLLDGGQRAVQQVTARLRSEDSRVGGHDLREQPQRPRHGLDEVLGALDGGRSGLRHLLVERRDDDG